MPGNAKPRRRKHRGTQTGSIDRRGRTGRPRSRQEAMAQARQRRSGGGKSRQVARGIQPPSWRSAAIRGVLTAAILVPILILFGQPAAGAIVFAAIAALFYVPLGYYLDQFMYRRKMGKYREAQFEKKASRGQAKD